MNYWFIKTKPNTYSRADLVKDKSTYWAGVRNYLARINLKALEFGYICSYYHSVKDKAGIGIARVIKYSLTTHDDRWVSVNVEAGAPLTKGTTPIMVNAEPGWAHLSLVNSSRISFQPVRKEVFNQIVDMAMND